MYKQSSITLEYDVDFKKKIGSGLHGVVFECTNKLSGKRFAVKLVADSKNNRQEVELQSKFQSSPNVVKIIDVFENTFRMGRSKPRTKCLFIVMELMESDLYSLIEEVGSFSEMQAANIFKQVACGLFEVHKDGVVHGDIKPENILVHKESKVSNSFRLSDFGSAFIEREGAGELSFTPFYVAPEVLLRDTNWNPTQSPSQENTQSTKSDVWSLGSLLYLLLTGSVPFAVDPLTSEMTEEIFNSTTKGLYNKTGQDWEQISSEAKDLFQKIFEVCPEERLSLDEVLVHPWVLKF